MEGGSGRLPIPSWIRAPRSWRTNQIAVNILTSSVLRNICNWAYKIKNNNIRVIRHIQIVTYAIIIQPRIQDGIGNLPDPPSVCLS